ncbi:MAG TPA: YfhO family protein [Thermoanaerobaculia bacterium]|nr:YfhO family protein [Thermoanaerobaculia bacterium]
MVFLLYLVTAALVLWLVHRFVTPLSRAAVLVLFALPLAITGYAVFTGGVYGPVDYPYQTEPLSALKPLYGIDRPLNAAATDVYGTMLPFRRTLQLSLQRGEWPLWNAYMLSGNVFAATAQAAQYSPFTLIACLLPAAVSFTYTCSVWLLIAAIGAFLLARELECSEAAALIAAAGWTYAASTILYIHTAMGGTLVYEPLLLMAAGRVARRPRPSSAVLLAIVLALMIFAGHPETLFLTVLAGAAYGIFELVRARVRPWRAIGAAVAGGALALLLCAIHLLPFYEAVQQSAELEVKTKYFTTAGYDMPAERVLSIVATEFFPFLHVRQWVEPPLGLTQAETSACGSVILALAVYAVWRRRSSETWFFFALAVVCIAVTSRWNPVVRAVNELPLMGITYEERLAFTAAFSLAILAALGVDEILRRRDFRAAALTLTVVLIALAAGTWWLTRNVVVAITFSDFGDYKIFAELFFLGLAALLLVLRPPIRVLAPALLGLLVAQRVLSEGGTFRTFPREVAYPPVAVFEPLRHAREPFRFAGQFYALLPGTNAFYGLEDVRGFDALHYGPSIKLWPLWCTFQPIWFNRVDDIGRPFLSFLNVRYAVITDVAPVPEGWREVARQRGAVLVENARALDRAFVPRRVRLGQSVDQQVAEMGTQTDYADLAWLSANVAPYERENGPGRVRIAGYSPGGRYLLDAAMERDGWIVISETAWKGWRAYVDGRRVAMQNANASFLSVHVPAGRHTVRVVYWPESFVTGRAITFATLAALIAFAILRRVNRRDNVSR